MTDPGANQPRPARPKEAHSLRRIVNEAYGRYIGRMARHLDRCWIAGQVVLEDDGQGALLLDNIALYNRLGFRETGRVSEKGFDRV